MAKTDPRPYPFVFVGAVSFTVATEFNGLRVLSVTGGTVTRSGVPLVANNTLVTADVLTITPTTPGGTVTLACQMDAQEFSGNYLDLTNKPSGGGSGGGNLGVAVDHGDLTLNLPLFTGDLDVCVAPFTADFLYAGSTFEFTLESIGSPQDQQAAVQINSLRFPGVDFSDANKLTIRFTVTPEGTGLFQETVTSSGQTMIYTPQAHSARSVKVVGEILSGAGGLRKGFYDQVYGESAFAYLTDPAQSGVFTGVRMLNPGYARPAPVAIATVTRAAVPIRVKTLDSQTQLTPPRGVSNERPASAETGELWFDYQIHKPLWFDNGWRDAAGTLV